MKMAAQTAGTYETISIAQGLSQGMVFDILQDREGFIWVATKNGLNRYDGYDFKVFTNDPYNPYTLSSNTIIKLFEDSKGRIWACTDNAGLNVYDKKSGKFFRITYEASEPGSLSGNGPRCIEELPDGRILVAVAEAGLNIIALPPDFFEKGLPPAITRLALPNEAQVYGIGNDKNGNTWIGGMDRSVYRFDPLKNSFIPLANGILLNNGYLNTDGTILINNNLLLSDGNEVFPLFDINKITAGNIIFNPKEKLWENHHRELHFYDVSRWAPGKTVKWNVRLPENTKIIYPFIIDRSGILWSGSIGYGLRKFNTAASKFKTYFPGNSVRFIVPSTPAELYVGNYAYGWQKLLNDSAYTDPFRIIPSVTQIDNFIILKSGDFFIKSDNRGYFKYSPASGHLVPYPNLNFYEGEGDKQPMLEDSKGNVWIPGLWGQFTRINFGTGKIDSFTINTDASKPMLSKSSCTALYEDGQGTCWIGTAEGFVKTSFANGLPQMKWYYNSNTNRNSLNYNHVSCFMDDPAEPGKYLWICTKGGGLNRLNKQTGDFFHLTTREGLPDDVVYGVLPDDNGNIWGSTNRGIFCMVPREENDSTLYSFRNFTKAYGLQDDEFNTGAYTKLSNGRLAFGGVNGLNIFNPKEILAAGFSPNVFITSIMVNNAPVTPGDKTGILKNNIEETQHITLNYLQDILTLEFSSLDFTAPAQNRYRYQLVGADPHWVESGSRRTATYLHLPPGNYTFNVQGSNSQGIWSDKAASLHITVLPPWWRSWPAYICYALLLATGIRAYFKFSVNRARLKSQLNFEQREAKRIKEVDSLKTQLYTNITHEFRTPLTVILGMAQQVVNNPREHLANGMDMIIRNGESLLKLVNEMLDLSKLETGKMSLQLVKGDVINFLRYIVESFNSLAESQHKQLHFLSSMDMLLIEYDPEKLRQIIANLLSNALKFTPEKGNIYITISEEKLSAATSESLLVIKVKDTGIGIPENQLEHIFDRFYQLDNSLTRKKEGTGIGLSLTKELVKLMEGRIEVKSPPTGSSKGTEFTVLLPVKRLLNSDESHPAIRVTALSTQINTTPITRIEQTEEKGANEKPLILLVEDNADVVAYTASCLPDYRLAVGKDGNEGFEIARSIIPDLVITDVMMPFTDGFEMCRNLRQDEHTSHIPIIMLTAKAGVDSRMEGLEQGADAYLEKPFHKEELLLRIRKLLELRKSLQQFYIKQAGVPAHHPGSSTSANIEPVASPEKTVDAFVRKITDIIEEHLTDEHFTIEQLCKKIFMSHSQLHRKLDALTGCSPNKFIRIIRLKKATSLLRDPSLGISSIAMECGYNDPGYFARVFKQEFGVSPQEWRLNN
jgi:signal transduction histidine kinase/DNA-binding response OmpR family regulator/ligand-binding sensor domain-containing protein